MPYPVPPNSIEAELARRRFKASAEGIQRRHRLAQAQAARLAATVPDTGDPTGVNPTFRLQLEAAHLKARALNDRPIVRSDLDHVVERLRAEGKLPPAEQPVDVGYEPTPEEILGDLAAPAPHPGGTETTPSAEDVLSGMPTTEEPWDDLPPRGQPATGALAQPEAVRHHSGKRSRK